MKNGKEILSQEQLNKLAKRKAFKVTLIFAVAMIFYLTILLLLKGYSVIHLLITLSVPIMLMSVALYVIYVKVAKNQLEDKQSVIFCKSYLPIGQKVEVVPIRVSDYREFILGLTDKATFYALHCAAGGILVYIQLYENEPLRKFTEISEEDFMYYFKLKNEK